MSPESEDRTGTVRLALRVLHDLTIGCQPHESDVMMLRSIAGADAEHLALDELCCEIGQEGILRINAKKRSAAA